MQRLIMDREDPNLGWSQVVQCRTVNGGTRVVPCMRAQADISQCASMVTLLLDLQAEDSDYPGPPGTQRGSFTARVSFGNGNGTAESVEVDWKRGTQLAVPASALSLEAVVDHFDDPESLLRARLSAFLTWGSGSHTFATRTHPTVSAAPGGGTAIILVPRHAAELQVTAFGDLIASAAVWLSGPSITSAPIGGFPLLPIPLSAYVPNGARALGIVNAGPGPDPANVTAVFRLSL